MCVAADEWADPWKWLPKLLLQDGPERMFPPIEGNEEHTEENDCVPHLTHSESLCSVVIKYVT